MSASTPPAAETPHRLSMAEQQQLPVLWGHLTRVLAVLISAALIVFGVLWARLNSVDAKVDKQSDRINAIDRRLEQVNGELGQRLEKLNGKVDQQGEALSGKIDRLSGRIDALDEKIDGRLDRIESDVAEIKALLKASRRP